MLSSRGAENGDIAPAHAGPRASATPGFLACPQTRGLSRTPPSGRSSSHAQDADATPGSPGLRCDAPGRGARPQDVPGRPAGLLCPHDARQCPHPGASSLQVQPDPAGARGGTGSSRRAGSRPGPLRRPAAWGSGPGRSGTEHRWEQNAPELELRERSPRPTWGLTCRGSGSLPMSLSRKRPTP